MIVYDAFSLPWDHSTVQQTPILVKIFLLFYFWFFGWHLLSFLLTLCCCAICFMLWFLYHREELFQSVNQWKEHKFRSISAYFSSEKKKRIVITSSDARAVSPLIRPHKPQTWESIVRAYFRVRRVRVNKNETHMQKHLNQRTHFHDIWVILGKTLVKRFVCFATLAVGPNFVCVTFSIDRNTLSFLSFPQLKTLILFPWSDYLFGCVFSIRSIVTNKSLSLCRYLNLTPDQLKIK